MQTNDHTKYWENLIQRHNDILEDLIIAKEKGIKLSNESSQENLLEKRISEEIKVIDELSETLSNYKEHLWKLKFGDNKL